MQCPGCGYEADDATIFCPQCRFQFRDITGGPFPAADTIIDLPERGIIADETVLEETLPGKSHKGLSDRELLQMEVQLLQPALLVVLITALVTYSVFSAVPFVPLTIAGVGLGVTGIICLGCGLICGIVFFFTARRSLVRFRSR